MPDAGQMSLHPARQTVERVEKPAPRVAQACEHPEGAGEPDEFPIYVHESALAQIVAQDGEGGLLVGYPYAGYVEVQGFLPAHLPFSAETWTDAAEAMRAWPGKAIVGWARVRAGHGVRLDDPDIVLHSSLFSLPWQVAFVVDPASRKFGFFQWSENRVRPCGFAIVTT